MLNSPRRFCKNQRRRFTQILQNNMKATRQGAKSKFGSILGMKKNISLLANTQKIKKFHTNLKILNFFANFKIFPLTNTWCNAL